MCVCVLLPLWTLHVAETSVANQWPDECCELWRQAGWNHEKPLQSVSCSQPTILTKLFCTSVALGQCGVLGLSPCIGNDFGIGR